MLEKMDEFSARDWTDMKSTSWRASPPSKFWVNGARPVPSKGRNNRPFPFKNTHSPLVSACFIFPSVKAAAKGQAVFTI